MTSLTRERFAQLTKDLVDGTMHHVDTAKVEIAFNVRQDGIIEYSARHVGLGINLTVSVREAELIPQKKQLISDVAQIKWSADPARMARLARKLNMPEVELPAFLRQMGYSAESINNGRAIELFLRALLKTNIR